MKARRGPHTVVHVLGSATLESTAQARIVAMLARHVDRDRYRIKVWFVGEPGPLSATLAAAGVGVRSVPFRRGLARGEVRRFVTAMRADRPKVLHLHVGGRAMAGLARAVAPSVPIIVHVHGDVAEDGSPVRPPLRMATTVIAASKAVATTVAPKATVIYAGVEVPEANQPRRSPIIGSIGRFERLKGYSVLIEAFVALAGTRTDVILELAGAGSAEPALRQRVADADLDRRVRFLGWVRDIGPLLRRWRVLAVPSLAEGQSLAAVEGMASGLPLVASRVGGLPELVLDGETGLLVPPGDPVRLRNALGRLLNDDDLADRLGAAARKRVVERFTAAETAQRIVGCYEEVLSAPPSRSKRIQRLTGVA